MYRISDLLSKSIFRFPRLLIMSYYIVGNLSAVRNLIKSGADIETKDNEQMTPLHRSAQYGN